jgi:uncharacterized membrane protein YdbT with pleckstrin-like domain
MEEERTIWEGSPSQWSNFMFYLLCSILTMAFGLGLLLALWKYMETKLNTFKITDQRIVEKRGILSKITMESELYRVKDIQLREPFLLRIFGLSNIQLITTDHDTPLLTIKGLDNGEELREHLRLAVDNRRDLKKVREIDFN